MKYRILSIFIVLLVVSFFYGYGFNLSGDYLSLSAAEPARPQMKYHTYESMLAEIQQHQNNHPEICKLYDFGVSSDKKTHMWAVKISDNVDTNEDQPNVLLSGGIHGNERPAPEMALYVIKELLDNKKKYSDLINKTQIWIIPVLNTAGHIRNTRQNANGKDLNRGFPENYDKPSLKGKEPETVNLLTNYFHKYDHIVAGIDLHTYGSIYISSWARTRAKPADWDAISDLGKKMAKTANYRFLPLHAMIGRTVQGGGADYRYGAHGTFYYGLELGRSHNPPASALRQLCERNLPGVLMMFNRVHHSTLTGHIKYQDKPAIATVTVKGIDTPKNIRVPYRSDKKFGRYYRILVPGKYSVTYTLDSTNKSVTRDVEIVPDKQTIVDIQF